MAIKNQKLKMKLTTQHGFYSLHVSGEENLTNFLVRLLFRRDFKNAYSIQVQEGNRFSGQLEVRRFTWLD